MFDSTTGFVRKICIQNIDFSKASPVVTLCWQNIRKTIKTYIPLHPAAYFHQGFQPIQSHSGLGKKAGIDQNNLRTCIT